MRRLASSFVPKLGWPGFRVLLLLNAIPKIASEWLVKNQKSRGDADYWPLETTPQQSTLAEVSSQQKFDLHKLCYFMQAAPRSSQRPILYPLVLVRLLGETGLT